VNVVDKAKLIRQCMLMLDFKDSEIKELATYAQQVSMESGEFLFKSGDRPKNLYFVNEGILKSIMHSPSGKDLVLSFYCAGDVIGEAAFFTGEPYASSALTVSASKLLLIPKEYFTSYIQNHPEVYVKTINILVRRIIMFQYRLEDFAGANALQRLLRILINLFEQFDGSVPLTKYSIADEAGLAPETTIRIMAHLEREGYIESSRGKVTLLDKDGLKELFSNAGELKSSLNMIK